MDSIASTSTKRRLWRPRFSLRTLAIVVTLVCPYFAAWEATRKYGVSTTKVDRSSENYRILAAYSPAPMVVFCFEEGPLILPNGFTYGGQIPVTRTCYLWLFGPTIRLPFQSDIEPIVNADGELLVELSAGLGLTK